MTRWIALGAVTMAALMAASCNGGTTPSASPSPSRPGLSSSPSSTPASPPRARTELVATLDKPLAMAVRAGDDALYIVGQKGKIWVLHDGQVDPKPVLDMTGKISLGNEQGLLGLAFSPSGQFAYVNFTDRKGDTNLVEYAWKDGRADVSTKRLVLFVDQPFANHNGGNLVFGPDGDLYIGLGDGGSDETTPSPGDPFRNGQNLKVLLGKMLRIQPRMPDGSLPPRGEAYAIPADNPFVGQANARPEIWAYGLRHPWRYSFDAATGDLWIGDVGAGAREEIDVQPAGSSGGQNYGWSNFEGTLKWRADLPDAIPPVYEYEHRGGGCAITGGYVYRGSAMPNLVGWYVFGDYCLGTLNALRLDASGRRVYIVSGSGVSGLSSFGQDQQGELYALSIDGEVFKLVP